MEWVNGLLIARLNLAPFIVTLGMLYVARGLIEVLLNGQNITNASGPGGGQQHGFLRSSRADRARTAGRRLGDDHPRDHVLHRSQRKPFGRWLYATGSNERAACSLARQDGEDSDLRPGRTLRRRRGPADGQLSSATADLVRSIELNAIATVVIEGAAFRGPRHGSRNDHRRLRDRVPRRRPGDRRGVTVLAEGHQGAVIILAVALDQLEQTVHRQRSRESSREREGDPQAAGAHARGVIPANPDAVLLASVHEDFDRQVPPWQRPASWHSASRPAAPRSPNPPRPPRPARPPRPPPAEPSPSSRWTRPTPYWQAEVSTARTEAQRLASGRPDTHGNEPDKQYPIDTAISKKVKAIILDPAGAKESVGAVQKATDAGIPVFLVNAEIETQGIAKSQIISNTPRAPPSAPRMGWSWAARAGTSSCSATRPTTTPRSARMATAGYLAVPDMKNVRQETANWDRAQGKEKMERLLRAHPDITGVIAGNDEMALGAIQALKDARQRSTR